MAPRASPRHRAAAPAPNGQGRTLSAADLAGLVRRAPGVVARTAASRVPAADLDERDPDYIRESLPRLWLLASLWFRAEVRNLERIPADGPVLMVGNHSGGNITPDTIVFARPGALDAGARVPAQVRHQSAKVDFGGRKGFIRLALDKDVPLVPIVAVGGQETALFLTRGERLARLLRLDRMLRLKVLPVSLALPWGLNVGDMLGHVPLPAKITIQVLPPIHLRERYRRRPDPDRIYDDLMAEMQTALSTLRAERRLPVLG